MSNDDETKPPYDVGYGKPPKKHRFKKDKSGNPKGRPKDSKGKKAIVWKVAMEVHTVQTPEGPRKVPVIDLLLYALRNQMAKGNHKATNLVYDLKRRLGQNERNPGTGFLIAGERMSRQEWVEKFSPGSPYWLKVEREREEWAVRMNIKLRG